MDLFLDLRYVFPLEIEGSVLIPQSSSLSLSPLSSPDTSGQAPTTGQRDATGFCWRWMLGYAEGCEKGLDRRGGGG